MVWFGVELIGLMGIDILVVVLLQCLCMFYDYFYQLFVQVINLLLDVICEEVVISLQGIIGGECDLFNLDENFCYQIVLFQLILCNYEFVKLVSFDFNDKVNGCLYGLWFKVICCLYWVFEGGVGLVVVLEEVCGVVVVVIVDGVWIIILFDCEFDEEMVLILLLFVVVGVYYYLVWEWICI